MLKRGSKRCKTRTIGPLTRRKFDTNQLRARYMIGDTRIVAVVTFAERDFTSRGCGLNADGLRGTGANTSNREP